MSEDSALQVIDTADLAGLSTPQLRERLAAALGHTAHGLAEMAACVRELESRGEDLSGLRLAILPYLRRIAYRQLLPEVVVAYAGAPKLLAAVANLPLPDQEQLMAQGTVPIAVVDNDGNMGVRNIDPRALSSRDLGRVFTTDGIAPPQKQLPHIKQPRTNRRYSCRISKTTRELLVGRARVPIAEVLTALSDAAGYRGEIDDEARIGNQMPRAATNLTPDEKERLVAMAKAVNMSEWEIVRRAILVWLL